MQTMWENFQKKLNSVYSPSDSLGHKAISVPILWETFSPEIGYEEAHLYSYW